MEERLAGAVNNCIYHALGERWYTAKDDPIALLRAESRSRNPWIVHEVRQACAAGRLHVLDVGCGAGFLANELARQGFAVTGLDASASSLAVARQYDKTRTVTYARGDAYHLPYAAESFEVACAMDFLEHVEEPESIVKEISRVLKPHGLFFFHTFNRTWLAWLIIIKGVEWFVHNTPRDLHVLQRFIKPAELRAMCAASGLRVQALQGFAPKITQRAFWHLLRTGIVEDAFAFAFTKSTLTGYTGMAVKESSDTSGGLWVTKSRMACTRAVWAWTTRARARWKA
jgi:2-polyprenyl-6-hydroxyphenyl methylase / 3-demethylubiquinone-9 3-methyltransferase